MKSQGTTFYTYSDVGSHKRTFQVLKYRTKFNSVSDTFSLEIPSELLAIDKDDELYKVTVEHITNKDEIERIRTFNTIKGVLWKN